MKVLYLIDSLGLGGAQTVVKGIFEAQKSNKDIFLFALRKRKINININHLNVKIFNSDVKYSFGPLKELKELVEKEKIEVLHCHLFRSQIFGYILKRKYFPQIKLIFHEHGEIFQKHILYNIFMRFSRKYINRYIAVSNATKQKLIEKMGVDPNKIIILYNFVDLEKFNPQNIKLNLQREREKLGIEEEEFVIGFVGRLAKIKGCEYLIKSLSYLYFPYKVLIAGDGPEREYLEDLASKLKVKDKIIFLGYQDEIINFYFLLNVLIMPSLSEASPMAFYESQAIGLPIIGSDVPAINEFIIPHKNGLLFEVKNEIDLSKKITYLIENQSFLTKLSKNSLKNIKRYSLKEYLKGLNKFYVNLIYGKC